MKPRLLVRLPKYGASRIVAVVACLLLIGGIIGTFAALRPESSAVSGQDGGQEETIGDGDAVDDEQVRSDTTANSNGDADTGDDVDADPDTDRDTDPDTTVTDSNGDSSTGGVVTEPASVALTQSMAEVVVPVEMVAIAGSRTTDESFFVWTLPRTPNSGCEGVEGRQVLVSLDSDGVQVGEIGVGGTSPRIIEGPGDRVVMTDGCQDDVWSVIAGSLVESGGMRLDQYLSAPDGYSFSVLDPVWSADGSSLLVHLQDGSGVLWLAIYGESATEPAMEQATGQILGEFGGGGRVIATSQSVSINGVPILALDPALGSRSALAQMSIDGQRIAVAAGSEVVIASEQGVIDTFDSGREILALDWSPTGQLLFSTEGDTALRSYDESTAERFSAALATAGNWTEIEFADQGRTVALSRVTTSGQAESRIIRLVSAQETGSAEADEGVPFGISELTVGDQPLGLRGIGVVEAGMTVAEVEAVVGGELVEVSSLDGCGHAVLSSDPNSPFFMVLTYQEDGPNLPWSDGIVARIEIGSAGETISGIRIGSTKAEVLATYGDRIEVSPHAYTGTSGGEYLTFVPRTDEDSDFRLVMETLDDEVTAIRSGLLPAVEFIEGCA